MHEILKPHQEASAPCDVDSLHLCEAVGRDAMASPEGVWEGIVLQGGGKQGRGWGVSAGPITHRGENIIQQLEN